MSSFFECSLALIPLFTLHSSLFTLHFSLFTFHSSLFTFHSSLSTLPPYHNPYHFSPFTIKSLFDQSTFGAGEKLPHLFTLHSSLFTLHSSLFTLHSSLFTLHFSLSTLHSPLSSPEHAALADHRKQTQPQHPRRDYLPQPDRQEQERQDIRQVVGELEHQGHHHGVGDHGR